MITTTLPCLTFLATLAHLSLILPALTLLALTLLALTLLALTLLALTCWP